VTFERLRQALAARTRRDFDPSSLPPQRKKMYSASSSSPSS